MRRTELRTVKIEKPLEVQVHICDACGKELTTSRDTYFGDERLVVEGEDVSWYRVGMWRTTKSDWPMGDPAELCSRECLMEWASRQPTTEWLDSQRLTHA